MKTFARVIAAVFMIVGVIVIMLGIAVAVSGFSGARATIPVIPGAIPNLGGLTVFIRVAAGGALGFQGLVLAAIGEVLWLMAAIADQMQQSTDYMAELVRRATGTR